MFAEQTGYNLTPPERPTSLADCERIVVLHNPYATHATELMEQIDNLNDSRHLGIATREFSPHPTERDPQDTIASLRSTFDPDKDGLVVVGGDGSYNSGLRAAMDLGITHPVGLVAAGHACDMSRQSHHINYQTDIIRMIRNGSSEQVHPLRIRATEPGSKTSSEQLAFGYFSLGLSGSVAADLNDPRYKQAVKGKITPQRYLHDAAHTVKSVAHVQPFYVQRNHEKPRELVELTYSNGSRMARFIRFGGMALAFNRAAVVAVPYAALGVEAARTPLQYTHLAYQVGKAALGKYQKLRHGDEDHLLLAASHPIPAQYDGEDLRYPTTSSLSIGFSEDSVGVVTTR